MTTPAAAAQIAAADPAVNVWLVANAGSGKTRVLTDRVARLLLRGVDPANILCLTYTKAAAAEMQNRLFRRLGAWAMAPEPVLLAHLAELGEAGGLSAARLRLARQLFARAIETPGGIRIQTIHSFCAGLLRRFPLEAGVSPAFTEIDDRSAALLRGEIFDAMAEGAEKPLLDAVLPDMGEDTEGFLKQIVQRRADLAAVPAADDLRAVFGLPAGEDEAALVARTFLGDEPRILAALVAAVRAGTETEAKAAMQLAQLDAGNPSLELIAALEGRFLFGATAKAPFAAKVGSFPNKDARAAMGPTLDALNALMLRVEAARPVRLALAAAAAAERLHHFAAAFLARYEAAKAARGWLDFDDLILRATALLTDPSVGPWVLYRLDGAIDHVLVDEAQDTSPAQWRIIAALTGEFTAGAGARDEPRSLFVVGDKKQSIYSFQGANVTAFDGVKDAFRTRFAGAGAALVEKPLVHSFRSSAAILQVVDRAFLGGHAAALGGDFLHQPFHEALQGRVDLWVPVPKAEKPEQTAWYDPVDLPAENDAEVVLARQVAREIRRMIDAGVQIPADSAGEDFRPLRAGDVLILVQRRKALFQEIIRACKAEGLPIAGADRLKLADELAVRDILALLQFLNTPDDDLSLAVALRSPLFGWSEQRLFTLAQGRPGHLWERLRGQSDAADTLAVLHDLRDRAEYLRPHDLIDRLLTRHRGRALLLGRLGAEAADAIDELLAQALAYERAEVPSLTGFLVWMEAGDVEAKRQAEGEGNQIRVMTVHGAKGLEAPLVILPETADRALREQDALLPVGGGVVGWAGNQETNPPVLAAAKADRRAAREAENLRLLYVALTRAKVWLIVAGAGACGEASWHGIVAQAMQGLPLTPLPGGGSRYQLGAWADDSVGPAAAAVPLPASLPAWAIAAASAPPAPVRVFLPSALGGAKAVAAAPVDPEEDVLARGTVLHLLLEHLAGTDPAGWPAVAQAMAATPEALDEAAAILNDPALAWLFGPESLAEAALSAPWNGGLLAGTADRLVVTAGKVTVVDFKSNAEVPAGPDAVPEAYLRQLGAYAHMLGGIYPGRAVETAILWTKGPVYMPVGPDIVRAALARAAIP